MQSSSVAEIREKLKRGSKSVFFDEKKLDYLLNEIMNISLISHLLVSRVTVINVYLIYSLIKIQADLS